MSDQLKSPDHMGDIKFIIIANSLRKYYLDKKNAMIPFRSVSFFNRKL